VKVYWVRGSGEVPATVTAVGVAVIVGGGVTLEAEEEELGVGVVAARTERMDAKRTAV